MHSILNVISLSLGRNLLVAYAMSRETRVDSLFLVSLRNESRLGLCSLFSTGANPVGDTMKIYLVSMVSA